MHLSGNSVILRKSTARIQDFMRYFAVFLTMLALLSLEAADLTTITGKTYKGDIVAGTCAEGLTILHSNGGVTVPLEDWPEDRTAEVARHIARVKKLRKLFEKRPDLKAKNGIVYKKYKILGFVPGGARVSCWNGIVLVKISDLPDSVQKQFEKEIAKVTPKSLFLQETPKGEEQKIPANLKIENHNSKNGKNRNDSPKNDDRADNDTGEIASNKKSADTKKAEKSEKSEKPKKAKKTKKTGK